MKIAFNRIASCLGFVSPDTTPIDTLLTDSRNLRYPASSLFFAINTPGGNDGHRFIGELYEKGVRHFVVNTIPEEMAERPDANFLIVPDSVKALQTVASRNSGMKCKLVAITGSRGKTTLKEWLFQLMEDTLETARSPRSYNSQTGVPLSMWEIEPSTELAIIEAGISRTGEMKALADCIQPDTVIFTNIGPAHSEGFNDNYEKTKEKALLAEPESVRTVIYNYDSPELRKVLLTTAGTRELISFSTSSPQADILLTSPSKGCVEYTFKSKTSRIAAPVETDYDLENAAAAIAFMIHSGVAEKEIERRFGNLHKIRTRLDVTEGVNGCSVIYDSYTSDFSSLRPAIDFMRRRKIPEQKQVLILSDLLHETSEGKNVYEAVAQEVRESGTGRFIGVGPVLSAHSNLFPENSLFYTSTEDLLSDLSTSDFESEIILVKGAPEFGFKRIKEMLEARTHMTVLEVNLDSIVRNYNYFRSSLPEGTGIVCMVKASGYGAGSREIAKTLQDAGAAYLAVAVLDEGIDLRNNGITMPIMVMNPKVVNYRSMFSYRLEPEIYSLEMLRDVIRQGRRHGAKEFPIHLKLDTGMHRMGFTAYELEEVSELLRSQDVVRVSSVFSHLATADCTDMDDYTLLQLNRFRNMTDAILASLEYPVKRHVLNSAGILRFPRHHYDMVRLGIGLYGANTLPPEIEKPLSVVSTLRTVIIAIREWEETETIGYGRKGTLSRKSKIATIPIGYADGMNRHFGRGAVSVKVNGKDAPTVGNICMDACMIDVTGIDCKVGDAVEIFGPEAPIQRLADVLDTIPYEVLTSVSPRVKRVYYRE